MRLLPKKSRMHLTGDPLFQKQSVAVRVAHHCCLLVILQGYDSWRYKTCVACIQGTYLLFEAVDPHRKMHMDEVVAGNIDRRGSPSRWCAIVQEFDSRSFRCAWT